jgi:hypothetical protein
MHQYNVVLYFCYASVTLLLLMHLLQVYFVLLLYKLPKVYTNMTEAYIAFQLSVSQKLKLMAAF